MNQIWTLLSILLVISGFISLLLAIRSWLIRSRPGQAAFAGLMLAAGTFSLFSGFELIAPTTGEKTFWLILENLGIVWLGPFWFLFVIGYTQRKWITPRWTVLLLAIPVLTILLFISGQWRELYYTSLTLLVQGNGPLMIGHGAWFWVQSIYAYVLMFCGSVLLIRSTQHMPGTYRRQVSILLAGILLPWVANAYYLLTPILFPAYRPFLDPTPFAFTLSGLAYSVGIFGFRLFDLMPIAQTAVFESIPEMVVVLDGQDRIVEINATGRKWLRLKEGEAIGQPARSVFSPWPELLKRYVHMREVREEIRIPGGGGDLPEMAELVIMPLKDARGRYVGRLIMERDITARRKVDDQLRLQSAALNAAANAIVITDTSGTCIWVNSAFSKITGYSSDEILGQKLSILKSGLQDDAFYKSLWKTILSGETWSGEIINKHKQGHLYIEEMTIAPVRDQDGRISNFIAVKQDITERKRTEGNLQEAHRRLKLHVQEIEALQIQLREQAIRDPLTGLFNRRFLEETLEREVARALRDRNDLCLAMIDVDHFKDFNDQYGHKAGDIVLQSLGRMLLNTTRTGDVACRYGGEEFVVVMPGASLEAARKRAEEWRVEFQAVNPTLPEYIIAATISIGLACFPLHGGDSDTLVDAADKALYQAKDAGRNRVKIYGEA
jgi:diguanylate cyclase (GGDEF)-like protein/PAS domain S-box-containing protein